MGEGDPSSSPMRLLCSLCLCFVLVSKLSQSATVVVINGVSEWKNSTVQLGDTIIFQHHNLFIFKNQKAFNVCKFSLAALLTKSNSNNYTWHAVRTGFFYFSFSDGSNNTACLKGLKLAIEVTPSSPENPAPSPGGAHSGGIAPSSPANPWHPEKAGSPASAPVGAANNHGPIMVPEKGGETPFIKSNPAVPLPAGEVDSATICTLPTSGHPQEQAVGALTVQRAFFSAIFWMMI